MLRTIGWLLLVVLTHEDREPTDKLVPRGWKENPWGPVANRAREKGQLPPIVMTPQMQQWDRWGRKVLREGDIVFRRADAKLLFGYFPFSRFVANASGSPYSHTGIVALEKDGPVVYDTTKAGVRRQPFAVWILDNTGPLGVKRLKPEFQSRIPDVIQYCRRVYEEQVPFDYNLDLDDRELYCVEMTEKAFRAAGLTLSQPIRLGDMENATKFPVCMALLPIISSFTNTHPVTLEQRVFFPGNERHGIWSSPYLKTVYPTQSVRSAAARPRNPKR
jgi:hypothetical protein